jgi:NADPH:quinone reductase
MVELARQRLGADADLHLADVGSPLPFPEVFARSLDAWPSRDASCRLGAVGGRLPLVDPMDLTGRNVSVVGLSWGSAYPWQHAADVRDVYGELIGTVGSQVRPVIDRVTGLAGTLAALADLEAGRTVGKVVVRPAEGLS